MLNTYNNNNVYRVSQKVILNPPCVGTLQKSHPKSTFVRFHKCSKYAEWIFSDMPRLSETKAGKDLKEIVVLQIMVFGENEFLMEYVYKSDWEENHEI